MEQEKKENFGTGKCEIQDNPCQAIFPEGTVIQSVAAGENHSLALDTEGNVWGWGSNEYYQLGSTLSSNVTIPKKILGLSNIKKITCRKI